MPTLNRAILIASLVAALGCATTARVHAPSTTPAASKEAPAPQGPLGELDQLFLSSYAARQAEIDRQLPPFIVVSGSDLVLRRGDREEKVRVIPDGYHVLKSIAHLPFALYLRMLPVGDGPLGEDVAAILAEFKQKIPTARAALASAGLTGEQLARQERIFEASSAFIDRILGARRGDAAGLRTFATEMGPLLRQNTAEAACLQITATHAQAMKWKKEMSPEEWRRLRVVNRGGHQPRYRSAATQYFARLLGDKGPAWSYPGESMSVIYAESLKEDTGARDLLSAVILDADASEAFFGDPWRLSEDVLSDGAAACIAGLPSGP